MPIKDINHIPKLKKRLKILKKKSIRVGILGDDELAMIGAVNEFGAKIKVTAKMRNFLASQGFYIKKNTVHIVVPERSFVRSTFDNKKVVKGVFRKVRNIVSIDTNLQKALDRAGLFMVSAIQKKIRSNIKPANHPYTVEKKGGKDKTLIHTGRLLQGITHQVV